MKSKWYWHKDKPVEVLVRQGVVGDYWLIPELNLTVSGNELFDTIDAVYANKIAVENSPPEKQEEQETGRSTWVPYLRVIDGKKK